MIKFVPATKALCDSMVLREEDRRELLAHEPGRDLSTAVWNSSCISSSALVALDGDGQVVAAFGITEGDHEVCPWLLCSALAERNAIVGMRLARQFIALLRRVAGPRTAFNWIHKDSTQARRFIQRLGFRIIPAPAGDFDYFYLPHV